MAQPAFAQKPAPSFVPEKASPAILDLVHLSRQSLGERELEADLLRLFHAQAGHILKSLSASPAAHDPKRRRDLAHTLKGSARAVGAWAIAQAAESLETSIDESDAGEQARLERLAEAVRATQSVIDDLLGS